MDRGGQDLGLRPTSNSLAPNQIKNNDRGVVTKERTGMDGDDARVIVY